MTASLYRHLLQWMIGDTDENHLATNKKAAQSIKSVVSVAGGTAAMNVRIIAATGVPPLPEPLGWRRSDMSLRFPKLSRNQGDRATFVTTDWETAG